MVGLCANQYEFAIKTIYKNVVKKFASIILLLKESMILFKRKKIQFYRIKLLKLVHIYIHTYIY